MKRLYTSVILLLSSTLLLLGCAVKEIPWAEIPQNRAPGNSALAVAASGDWMQSWEKLQKDAQREGQIVIYSSSGPTVNQAVSSLAKKYGINTEIIAAPGAVWVERVKREQRAGIYLADMYLGGPNSPLHVKREIEGFWDPLQPMLISQVVEPAKWLGKELNFLDVERKYVLAFLYFANVTQIINSNLAKPEELKSYYDLLNPKWKENIVMLDPTKPGFANVWVSVTGSKLMNLDFMRSLVNQKPVIVDDKRTVVEWVARGKYATAIAATPEMIEEFIGAGAPILRLPPMKEGTWASSGGGNLAVMNKRPHPIATRLFINLILSKEGQAIFSQAYGAPSGRGDVPVTGFDPLSIPDPKVKYLFSSEETVELDLKQVDAVAKEIFSPLLRR